MPKKFEDELDSIKKKLLSTGELAQSMLQEATNALVHRDGRSIKSVFEKEEELDKRQVALDDSVMRTIIGFSPVALDLRFLLMVARITTELERIGDQACNMCEQIQLLLDEQQPEPVADLARMADIAADMVRKSLGAFSASSAEEATDVIKVDDEVDALNDQIFRDLLGNMLRDPNTLTRGLAILLTARALERIADHATNIAEEVVFMVKGKDIRHLA